jgi:hypothetical protein
VHDPAGSVSNTGGPEYRAGTGEDAAFTVMDEDATEVTDSGTVALSVTFSSNR